MKIYIAGHIGMVGSAIVRRLNALGQTHIITRTRQNLGWTPKIIFNTLVKEMTQHDLAQAQNDQLCHQAGTLYMNTTRYYG